VANVRTAIVVYIYRYQFIPTVIYGCLLLLYRECILRLVSEKNSINGMRRMQLLLSFIVFKKKKKCQIDRNKCILVGNVLLCITGARCRRTPPLLEIMTSAM